MQNAESTTTESAPREPRTEPVFERDGEPGGSETGFLSSALSGLDEDVEIRPSAFAHSSSILDEDGRISPRSLNGSIEHLNNLLTSVATLPRTTPQAVMAACNCAKQMREMKKGQRDA